MYSRTSAGRIGCGSQYPNYIGSTLTTLVFVMGNGTEINLVDNASNGAIYSVPNACNSQPNNWDAGRGTLFHSVDGTLLQFTSDSTVLDWNPNAIAPGTAGHGTAKISGNLVFPNGVTYRIDNSNVSWIRDRNGNKLSITYSTSTQQWVDWYLWVYAPAQIVDSLNRTITINYSDSSCGGCTSVNYPGAAGASRAVKVNLANLSAGLLRSGYSIQQMNQLFNQGSPAPTYNFDPTLASSIQFPDGSQYSFLYNSYGELARITLPTGGAYEYDYGDGNNAANNGFQGSTSDSNPVMIYRRLQERREYPTGGYGNSYSSRTHYSVSYPSSSTVDTDVAYDSSGNTLTQTIHTMNGSPLDALSTAGTGCNAWNEGLEVQTDRDPSVSLGTGEEWGG